MSEKSIRTLRMDYYPTNWFGRLFFRKKRVLKLTEATLQTRRNYSLVVGNNPLFDFKEGDSYEGNAMAEQIDIIARALAILIANDGKPDPPEWMVRSLKKESPSSLLGFMMHAEWILNSQVFTLIVARILGVGLNEYKEDEKG